MVGRRDARRRATNDVLRIRVGMSAMCAEEEACEPKIEAHSVNVRARGLEQERHVGLMEAHRPFKET